MTVKEMIDKLQNIYDNYGNCDVMINPDCKLYRDFEFEIFGVGGYTDVIIVTK